MRWACFVAGLVWAASSGAEALYRVPWPEGLRFTFTQVHGGRITTHFTKATAHAVDVAMPVGVPVLAARAGVIEAVEARHGASADDEPLSYEGNFVRVRHDDGTAATYAHLRHASIAVAPGETVRAGQLLAESGDSGDVLEPHLHFVVTTVQKNSSGWREEVSVPVTFYVGVPPFSFAPRTNSWPPP
jgi:murein DD-endopeptidase MepM/ murein hydrolase activator NlpD